MAPSWRLWWTAGVAVLALMLLPVAAFAETLAPLMTQTAETIPSGTVQLGLGASYFDGMQFPFFTPNGALTRQTLFAVPQFSAYLGVAKRVEIQALYELLYRSDRTSTGQNNSAYGSGDARLFTKVRIMHEDGYWPALGVRFGTKLPNGNRTQRLSTDDTDFGIEGLASKTFGPVTAHLNFGMLLLGNSGSLVTNQFKAGGQDDLFTYDFALASKPLVPELMASVPDTDLRLLGEIIGQTGSRYDNNRNSMRFGLQLRHTSLTLYSGVSAGLDTGAENVGAFVGMLYAFDAGKLIEAVGATKLLDE